MTLNTGRAGHDEAAELVWSTCVAMPFIGARTVVRSRLRWASSARGLGLHVSGKLLERQLGLPSTD